MQHRHDDRHAAHKARSSIAKTGATYTLAIVVFGPSQFKRMAVYRLCIYSVQHMAFGTNRPGIGCRAVVLGTVFGSTPHISKAAGTKEKEFLTVSPRRFTTV